jgi:hypothetical protein
MRNRPATRSPGRKRLRSRPFFTTPSHGESRHDPERASEGRLHAPTLRREMSMAHLSKVAEVYLKAERAGGLQRPREPSWPRFQGEIATECRTAQRHVGSRRPERSDYWRKGRHEHVNGQSKRQNSEASIMQRPNRLCEALFTYVESSTGEIRRGSSYGASAAAARSAMRTVLARADEGTAAKDSDSSISAWVEHRLATHSRGNSGCRRLPRRQLGYQLGYRTSQSRKRPIQ